ncbi:TPA: sugar phosphate isomerase/epimerase [Candidatus Bathyarchaeota archaeon]|nr:sugar phosphate isomerase/epimerase [Candidatus Bathyarchaeota archaeon]
MKKGVNAWIYPSGFTVDEVLDSSAKIGFEGVELNLDEKSLKFSKKKKKAIVEKAASLGLELPSLCTNLFWKFNLASPYETTRKMGVEIIKKGCEFASDIGSKVFLVVPAVAVSEVSYREMWNLSKESILKAASMAEDYGIILGIENVWNRFLYSPLEFRKFIEEINHPYVKVYFDVGNIHFLGFPQQWIRHLSDLIVCVHLKDFLRSKRQSKPLLEGDVPWLEVMKALREVGYNGFLNVEVSPYPGHPLKAAMDSKTALDLIFQMG